MKRAFLLVICGVFLLAGRGEAQVEAIVIEAESGTGPGILKLRGRASKKRTVNLFAGATRAISFSVNNAGSYFILVRYSNDNGNGLASELVEVTLDGQSVGSFTGVDTGSGGFGWNIFAVDSAFAPQVLSAGNHDLALVISGGDGFGIEIDKVTLQETQPPPPEEWAMSFPAESTTWVRQTDVAVLFYMSDWDCKWPVRVINLGVFSLMSGPMFCDSKPGNHFAWGVLAFGRVFGVIRQEGDVPAVLLSGRIKP